MKLPTFPESHHSVIQPLLNCSDQDLLQLFQQHQEKGQYFTAIFCRYGQLVYTLVKQCGRSPVQTDYLFAKTWKYIFHKLSSFQSSSDIGLINLSLRSWILNMTAIYINQEEIPAVETIDYSLSATPPPLWCYLEATLDRLPASLRLMIIMAQTFHWSETKIAAYLQAEGELLSAAEVESKLAEAYKFLQASLPEDIQEIYLGIIAEKPVSHIN